MQTCKHFSIVTLSLILLLIAGASIARGQELRIVNAASLSAGSVAPGTIVTIFGTNLGAGVAYASDVQKPPVSLGGVSVTIGGVAAALFYVSSTQINGVVDAATPLGMDAVVVTSATATHVGTLTVDTNAPAGLFSMYATGTRDGAILNAITFLLGDFSALTSDSPTFLALFATGLNLSVKPVVTIGGVPVDVAFFGAAPCCDGLQQINIMLPTSLAGAGRVPVVVSQNKVASNVVQVVILPPAGDTEFPTDTDNTTRARELADIAWIPGTSLVLVADQNDDVVRVVDVKAKQVTDVIVLSEGSHPVGVAVTTDGLTAVVAESGTGKAAIIDLKKLVVAGEVATGPGPVQVAIIGSLGLVVNTDNGTVSIINLLTNTVQKTLPVGRGPDGIAVDSVANLAYVVNEDEGTVTVIDLSAMSVTETVLLGSSLRPESIALTGTGIALITIPSAGPSGEVIVFNLTSNAQTTASVNPANSGGAGDVIFFNGKVYFANQAGGTVSVASFSNGTLGPITTIKTDLGPRSLAIDAKDNLLVVGNEGSGKLVVVDLTTNTVVGLIDAVSTSSTDTDDHGDRENGVNLPAIQTVSPAAAKSGTIFSLVISGSGLGGASGIVFDVLQGNGDQGNNGTDKNKSDNAITVTTIVVNGAGTQIIATVTIASDAQPGQHVVRVTTPNGESSGKVGSGNIFTVSQ